MLNQIDTTVRDVSVAIDGAVYPVAAKTVAVADKLREASLCAAKEELPKWKLWRMYLVIVIGRAAVAELFSSKEDEDLDRMEAIYTGVMAAFDYNGKKLRAEREKAELDHLHDLAQTLTTIADKVQEVYGKYPGIARPRAENAQA